MKDHRLLRLAADWCGSALLCAGLLLGAVVQAEPEIPGAVGSQKPTANFDWSVPDRYVVNENGIFLPATNDGMGTPLDPGTWTIELNGCSSVPNDNGGIVDYHWTIEQPRGSQIVKENSGASCRWTFNEIPAEGVYEVTLRVTDAHRQTDKVTQRITIQDWLIVGLGDSYSSGEGVPDLAATLNPNRPAQWVDEPCHRSSKSHQAKIAQILEKSDPKTSVTFVHSACSGAKITEGELSSQPKPYPEVPTNSVERGFQVKQVKDLVGSREIDLMLNGIGGNDVKFVEIIISCMLQEPCYRDGESTELDPTLVNFVQDSLCADAATPQQQLCRKTVEGVLNQFIASTFPESAAQLFRRARDGISDAMCFASKKIGSDSDGPCADLLPGTPEGDECKLLECVGLLDKYALLQQEFVSFLPDFDQSRHVTYPYPNFTEKRDPFNPESLILCGSNPDNPGANLPGASQDEWRWVRDTLLGEFPGNDADEDPFNDSGLNYVMRAASGLFGWNYVLGIKDTYGVHGYCATEDPFWINHLVDVLPPPVGNGNNAAGFVHPKEEGLTAYCTFIANYLLPELYPGVQELPVLNCSNMDNPANMIDATPRLPLSRSAVVRKVLPSRQGDLMRISLPKAA